MHANPAVLRRCVQLFLPLFAPAIVATVPGGAQACTSVLVTRGASVDGSVMITYHCDDAGAFARFTVTPAADHQPGDVIEIPSRDPANPQPRGTIPQVAHTYKVVGGLINEHQLALSETTFGGRKELENPDGLLEYPRLMFLALQRARTAREAIKVMTELVAKHGYESEGESISIADTQEAWILEIVGTGPGGKGAVWAAIRVPDGQISCHANQSRLGEIPRNDPENCLYSDNVESFAVSKGWYDPKSGQPFRFCDAYCPDTPLSRRICDARVWSVFRRAAPSLGLTSDYIHCKPGTQPYPLCIVPDRKISAADVFALIRDHYEGTEFDMSQGVDAGPFGLARRWRPVTWKVDGVEYTWDRPIATQQTAFSSVTQSRADMPDAVGGLVWYGMDDSTTTCYVPFYCCIDQAPPSYMAGSIRHFSMDSAWWVFNLAANYAYLKYSMIVPEIQAVQKDIESNLMALQPVVEKTAVELAKTNPDLARRYLTDYCVMHAEQTVGRWRTLTEDLITKYNDGYVRDEHGKYPNVGYPEPWLRRTVRERPEQYRLPATQPAAQTQQ